MANNKENEEIYNIWLVILLSIDISMPSVNTGNLSIVHEITPFGDSQS